MKNPLPSCALSTLTLFLVLFFISCNKELFYPSSPTINNSNSSNILVPTNSDKKGADFSTNTSAGTWSSNIVNLNSNWFYTWGTPPPSNLLPSNIEFVPMFWGASNVNSSNLTLVQNLYASHKVNYVLGFNEPDRTDQSNVSVQNALELWPQLEGLNIPLGSPAASYPTQQWFYDFMDSTVKQHKRVDFICVHMYVGTDDANFVQVLQSLYDKYHLPIWITEFATADWNASSVSTNRYTPDQVLSFMQRLLPKLEALPFVKRYSWFSGSPTDPALWPSALVDTNGNLTTLGKWYADYKP